MAREACSLKLHSTAVLFVGLPAVMSVSSKPPQDPGTKALLASLESVVMDLNDMENMIENFEESAAESFFSKV